MVLRSSALLSLVTTPCYCLILAAGAPPAADSGGLRQVRTAVETVGEDYRIQVRFLAVACFDRATNQEMNLELGRSFALEALARRLSRKERVELLVSGARTTDGKQDGKTFALTVQVPRAGVKVVDPREASDRTKSEQADGEVIQQASADPSTGSRKGQYEKMILQLSQLLRKEWKRIGSEAGQDAPGVGKVEVFRKKVASSFDQLAAEVRNDLELTNLGSDLDPDSKGEKDQLLATLKAEREALLRKLNP
jgi:hypothetical protein